MGLIDKIFGGAEAAATLGNAAQGVAEVFTPSATKRMEGGLRAYLAALDEHGTEFRYLREGPFDRFVNGLNRLPRPMLAFGTLGLFIYAMAEPAGFARRMQGLAYVPEPLWWLLGAIVSFYFGAREAYYFRGQGRAGDVSLPKPDEGAPEPQPTVRTGSDNPALDEWRESGN